MSHEFVRFEYKGNKYIVEFISCMGKDDADYLLTSIPTGESRRVKTRFLAEYAKGGIERKALAEWEKDNTRRFREWCRARNENYLNRYC